jgi:hypothetical protein
LALLINLVFCVEGPNDARINPPKHNVYVNTHRNSAAVPLRAQQRIAHCRYTLGTILVLGKFSQP